jgi:aldehyde dehydrogenase (NAD+)
MMARLFIGGTFRDADKVEPVIEAAARSALDGWLSTPATERADALNRFADALQSRAADTNELCTRKNGMPIRLSRGANGVFRRPCCATTRSCSMMLTWTRRCAR